MIFCGNCSSNSIALPTINHRSPVRVCSPCHSFELSRLEFESKHVQILQKGEIFKKHAHGIGLPKSRTVKLSQDRTEIIWGAEPKHRVIFSKLIEVTEGQATPAFKRTGQMGNDNLCFSLVCKDRTLDLESSSQEVRQLHVAAWRSALKHIQKVDTAISQQAKLRKIEEARVAAELEARRQARLKNAQTVREKYKKKY